MIKFGIANVFLTYGRETYYYTGAGVDGDVALAIGGHESAFLADLVVSYLMEVCSELFEGAAFRGIYRNDGFVVFKKK